jgi:hypothetical protein
MALAGAEVFRMRAIAIWLFLVTLALPDAQAEPLPERIVAPPPPPGMAPRSGTYREPAAGNHGLDFTVKPRRPLKKRKTRR